MQCRRKYVFYTTNIVKSQQTYDNIYCDLLTMYTYLVLLLHCRNIKIKFLKDLQSQH